MELDKAPYFVTLALALFGWSANQVVSRVIDAPTLEYRAIDPEKVVLSDKTTHYKQRITITNLTRKLTFSELTLMLTSRPNSQIIFEQTQLRPIAPAFEGDEPWSEEGRRVTFTVPRLHPGASVVIVAAYKGEQPPTFRIKTNNTIYATEANWETWFVRNELLVLIALGAIWLAVIAVYAFHNLKGYFGSRRTVSFRTDIPMEPV